MYPGTVPMRNCARPVILKSGTLHALTKLLCGAARRRRRCPSMRLHPLFIQFSPVLPIIDATAFQPQRSERWMYRSAGPNWRIQVNSSEYMYLSGKRCNTILKFRTSGTRYSTFSIFRTSGTRYSQFSSLSSVTLFWRQKLN
jgi:hypothetical protein